MSLEHFRGLSFEDFAGCPRIADIPQVTLRPLNKALERERVGSIEIIHWFDQADAYVADEYAASFLIADRHGDSKLFTVPKFRRRGIGEELVYRALTRTGRVVQSRTRNPESQRLYRRVYDRIQRELELVAA